MSVGCENPDEASIALAIEANDAHIRPSRFSCAHCIIINIVMISDLLVSLSMLLALILLAQMFR